MCVKEKRRKRGIEMQRRFGKTAVQAVLNRERKGKSIINGSVDEEMPVPK